MSENTENSEYSKDWIWVRSGQHSEGNRVAIYEQDFRHPDGQAFVYGDRVRQVYPTSEVVMRMREGFLAEERNYQAPRAVEVQRAEEAGTTVEPSFTESTSESAAQRRAREKAEREAQERN